MPRKPTKNIPKMREWVVAVAMGLSMAVGCAEPDSTETYMLNDGSGRYYFRMDMTDSLCVYDLSFYTRVDDRRVEGFPMTVALCSPSGKVESETLWFDCRAGRTAAYRTDCVPHERGMWQMTVRADARGMRGLGLICARRYGTR